MRPHYCSTILGMTVAELIAQLQALPPDAPIYIPLDPEGRELSAEAVSVDLWIDSDGQASVDFA